MRAVALLSFAALTACACGGGGSPMTPTAPPAPAATTSPAPAPTPTPLPSTNPLVLRSASLRGANGHSCSGTAQIVQRGDSYTLELLDDFRIDSGNTDVYLTSGSTTIQPGDRNLGNLSSLTGASSYELRDDGGRFRHVMLWCRPFRVPIGIGDLR